MKLLRITHCQYCCSCAWYSISAACLKSADELAGWAGTVLSFSFNSDSSDAVEGEVGSDFNRFSIENGFKGLGGGEGHSDLMLLTSVVLESSSCSKQLHTYSLIITN